MTFIKKIAWSAMMSSLITTIAFVNIAVYVLVYMFIGLWVLAPFFGLIFLILAITELDLGGKRSPLSDAQFAREDF